MISNNANIARVSQSLSPGNMVQLFTIDLSPLGVNQRFAFSPNHNVVFRGQRYTPVDVKSDGFEYNGQGALPQPRIAIGNPTRILSSAAVLYGDLVGARLYRIKTYRQFLDDGESPDADAIYQADIYDIEQKVGHDNTQIEFILASSMDQEGRKLPGRTILQTVCLWRYRVWTGDHFDYSKVQCPYSNSDFYNRKDEAVTDPALDQCSRTLTGCKKRFGANNPLPFGGFPGVARVRV